MCRSKKIREVDSLTNLIHERFKGNDRLEIPEIAIDPHTAKGKALYGSFNDKDGQESKRWERWFNESSMIENVAYVLQIDEKFRSTIYI